MKITIVPTATIPPQVWDEIWLLTERFYECERAYAEGRLRERQYTALVRTGRRLVGMAAVDVIDADFEGPTITAFFTSHVLLREELRGHNVLQRIGIRFYLGERLKHPLRPIYWFFDTFSCKSYLLLPRNCRDYWPRHDQTTPPWALALMDRLARQIYGADWRPAQGIVARSGKKRLKAATAPLEPGQDGSYGGSPDLAFFARSNPGHAEGDMLVCLCPLSAANWLHAGSRALRRMVRSSGKLPALGREKNI